MKKFLTMVTALAVFAGASTAAMASGPARQAEAKKTTVETKMPAKKETVKKETMKKETKGTKTGAAAPIKKHHKTMKKTKKY